MISWLLVIISAYFFFGAASLGDKVVLAGKPAPKAYTFYVAVSGVFAVFLMPFVNFAVPNGSQLGWVILEAFVYTAGLYAMFSALERFDVSRVMATIGATQPIFVLFLAWLFWGFQATTKTEMLAFIMLLAGTVIISFKKNAASTSEYLKITILAAIIFSLDYILQKLVFLGTPFLQGFIWMKIFSFLFVLLFLLSKKSRKEIFGKQTILLDKKTRVLFLCTQASGGAASLLQSAAIFLAPVGALPIINSLRGIQYIFLFAMTLFLSFFFPKILKEEKSKKAIAQKIISIILIILGLAILVL